MTTSLRLSQLFIFHSSKISLSPRNTQHLKPDHFLKKEPFPYHLAFRNPTMLFTNPPKCSNHTSPIAPKIVSIFSAPQPRPLHLRLPENYIPQPPPEFFHCGELVVIEEEFENYKSSNRSSDTPVYRILRWYKESGPESSRRQRRRS